MILKEKNNSYLSTLEKIPLSQLLGMALFLTA
jgi:hypothetical protein